MDYAKGRVYIPQEDLRGFGVSEEVIASGRMTPEFRALMQYEVEETRKMFAAGAALIAMVDRELAVDLDLFTRGGLEILNAIESQDYDVLKARPAISKWRKVMLLAGALNDKFIFGRGGRRSGQKVAA